MSRCNVSGTFSKEPRISGAAVLGLLDPQDKEAVEVSFPGFTYSAAYQLGNFCVSGRYAPVSLSVKWGQL